ncbi:hypothetical protein [Flavobacterium sp.]|uniref:hypothetical protein n=1 Tax=Flavobacterium sp. TaxID=239 RepID=UPI00286B6235|nr:hypothetical protein [Flavobacterium sp.]
MKELIFLTAILFCSTGFSQNKDIQTINKVDTNKKSNIKETNREKSDILIDQNITSLLKIDTRTTHENNNQLNIKDRKIENDPLANSILKVNPKNKL